MAETKNIVIGAADKKRMKATVYIEVLPIQAFFIKNT